MVTERQAGVAIEGVVRQQEIAIAQLAVDTHGFTNFGMGISRPLGFDLCARLRGMRHRRLFVPKGVRVPRRLKPIVDRNVSLKDFENEWDGLVRLAASIYGGWTSAVLALRRFGSAASGHPVHRAGTALGKINRTIFLCDYFAEPEFRQLLNRMLSHGESVHTLQHAIRYGTASSQRARRHQELVAMSGALTLLTNIIIAWNTHHMQTVLDRWHQTDEHLDHSILTHIGPAGYRHINLKGTLSFPLEHYWERLFGNRSRRSTDPHPSTA